MPQYSILFHDQFQPSTGTATLEVLEQDVDADPIFFIMLVTVQVIANTASVLDMGDTPHDVQRPHCGC